MNHRAPWGARPIANQVCCGLQVHQPESSRVDVALAAEMEIAHDGVHHIDHVARRREFVLLAKDTLRFFLSHVQQAAHCFWADAVEVAFKRVH